MNNHVAAWLELQKSELVGLAEDLVDKTRLHEPQGDDHRSNHDREEDRQGGKKGPPDAAVSTNQIRNLLAAAQNGSPLAVLVNFLRYQRARNRGAWRHEASFRRLEELFLKDLPDRCQRIPAALTDEQRFDAEARISAQLLGFVSREYAYRRHVYVKDWEASHGGNKQ
jgi:hypothetical protein